MNRKTYLTTGRVKFVRPDKQGYIIPDRTLDGYVGKNIRFDNSVCKEKVKIGDLVTVSFKVDSEHNLYAKKVKKSI